MTVDELIEELIRLPQDSNENLEVLTYHNCAAARVKRVKRQTVFDPDGSNPRTGAILILESVDPARFF